MMSHLVRLPELSRFSTTAERRAAVTGAFRVLLTSWFYWLYAVCAVGGIVYIRGFLSAKGWLPTYGGAVFAGLFAAVFLVSVPLIVARRRVQRHLREELIRKGVPICLGCGYDLR